MKTIRLLYPNYASGGLETYYFGANLLTQILPENDKQPLIKVEIAPPDGKEKTVAEGVYARDEVLAGIRDAMETIEYDNVGIIWIDAHPDVSTVNDGDPNAHAMVLGSLMGNGADSLSAVMKNRKFRADEILYVGLQKLHDDQEKFLEDRDVDYKVQTDEFVSENNICQG